MGESTFQGFEVGVLYTGSLNLSGGSSFNADPGLPAQEDVTGSVSLNGATLNFTPMSGFTPTAGYQYTFIENDGADAVSGNFVAGSGIDAVVPGTALHEGDVLSTNFLGTGRTARITYKAGPGHNSVAITLSPVTPTIDNAPGSLTNSTTATFTFSDVDSGVTFLTGLDSTVLLPSPSPTVYSGLRPGSHTFHVAAVDSHGDQSASTSSASRSTPT